jgi:hypothetical protein
MESAQQFIDAMHSVGMVAQTCVDIAAQFSKVVNEWFDDLPPQTRALFKNQYRVVDEPIHKRSTRNHPQRRHNRARR